MDISLEDLLSPGERRLRALGDGGNGVRTPMAYGNDETPLVATFPEEPPSHWGVVLTDRSRSDAYRRFVEGARRRNQQRGA